MSPAIIEAGWIVLAVSAALAGGMMLTFSNFVMPALARVPNSEAVRAMQRINEDVINPLFLALFIGTGPAMALWVGLETWAVGFVPLRALGAGLYLVGVVGVTARGNVPLNNRLAAIEPEDAAPDTWARYAGPWLRWNHTRTVAAALSAGAVLFGG